MNKSVEDNRKDILYECLEMVKSQSELARLMEMPRSTVLSWFKREGKMSFDSYVKLLDIHKKLKRQSWRTK